MKILVIAGLLLLTVPVAGSAQSIDVCYSELNVSCTGMRVSICPRGDFEQIRNGCGGDDDYIEVIIRHSGGDGIAGIPPTDYWMNACDEQYELALCVQHIVADSLTSINGRTTFSGRISAGGCIPEGGIYVSCQGATIMNASCTAVICLDVVLVGPDINGDGEVNLSDFSLFGWSYNMQVGDVQFSTCCDFNDDGECNLSDLAFFGQHYQHQCF